MNLYSTASFDGWPLLLELIHHLFPNEEALVGELFHSILRLLLEQVESEAPLNRGGFLHQESQVLVGFSGLVHSEVFLEHLGGKNGPLRSLEHACWYLDQLADLILVGDAVEHLLLGWLIQVLSSQLDQRPAVNVSQLDVEVSEELLKVHQDEGDRAPLVDVCSPERDELRRLVNELSFPEHELMQRVLVHELVVAPGLSGGVVARLCTLLSILGLCILLRSLMLGCRESQLLTLEVADARLRHGLVHRYQGRRSGLYVLAILLSPSWWLQVKLDRILVELFGVNFISGEHLGLVVEPHALELDWRGSFLEGWSQIDIFWDDASVEKADHALVDVFL